MRPTTTLAFCALLTTPVAAQRHADRGAKILEDRSAMQDSSLWIYNDLDEGFARARKAKKPLLVAFR